jgi:hypothetical protein
MKQIKTQTRTINKTIKQRMTTTQQTNLTYVTTQISTYQKYKTGMLPVCQTMVGYHSHL